MKRRDFFKATMPIVLPSLINGISLKALADSPFLRTAARGAGGDRVLVLIQLNGGDGRRDNPSPPGKHSASQNAPTQISLPEGKGCPPGGIEWQSFAATQAQRRERM